MTSFLFTNILLAALAAADVSQAPPIKILFLGDNGHHRPAERFQQLQPVLRPRGIQLTYTDRVTDLNQQTLNKFDGLIIYANIVRIAPEQEKALLEFVANGKGFIPIHCASYCFLNSPKYIQLVGAQFRRHGTGVFRTTRGDAKHVLLEGYQPFQSWDETYVHHRHHEKDRIVLTYRVDREGKEPWTWVRNHGEGRVFYTAWGHDGRTWSHPGFHNLIERGIRWAVGRDVSEAPAYIDRPKMTSPAKNVKPFEYVDAVVPYYPAGRRWGVLGEPINKMQSPLPAQQSIKHFVTPVGFEVKLFAAEPNIGGKPICMNWDHRGRLWIAETVDYPNEIQPEGKGRDRIRICEDTNHDGRADKFTVFAENLSIPTSLLFYRGGVIVHQAPHTLFLQDTDGDDRADVRHKLFTGWSTRDTHAGPSNMQYGIDNWIYSMVGYAGFQGNVGGERDSFRQGFFRFDPARLFEKNGLLRGDETPARDGAKTSLSQPPVLEFLRNTNNNSWGVGVTEEGLLFGSTANRNPSIYLPIPNRYYERVRGWSSTVLANTALDAKFHPITNKVRQVDHHERFTAGAGHAIYTARAYPPEYWNRTAFVNGPTGHLTATFVLQKHGGEVYTRNAWNLLASDDEWSAPIMAEVGPDGQVWVIDWYNYIVQHNPTPAGYKTGKGNAYVTDLRDKTHGRIYRVVYTGKIASKDNSVRRSLDADSPEQLVSALSDKNMFWRKHAQRLLVERGKKDIREALVRLVKDSSVDEIGLNAGAIHALWTLHGLGLLDGSHPDATAAAIGALRHKSAGVRRNAALALPANSHSAEALLEADLLDDPDGQVRLAALLALADAPPQKRFAERIVRVLQDPRNLGDRWITDAAISAAAMNAGPFLHAMAVSWTNRPNISPAAIRVVSTVAEHYARGAPTEGVGELLASLGKAPTPIAEAAAEGLARGWPADHKPPLDAQAEQSLVDLLPKLKPTTRSQMAALGVRWGSRRIEVQVTKLIQTLMEDVQNEQLGDARRTAAASQLINFRIDSVEAAQQILAAISPRTSPELAQAFFAAVEKSQAPKTGEAIIDRWKSFSPSLRRLGLRALLSRRDWTESLITGAEQGKLGLAELTLDQKQSLAAHPVRRISTRAKTLLARGGGLPNPDRQKVLDQFMKLTRVQGDVALGKEVFKKQCAKCHTHSGEGTHIGPDLTGMAVHSKAELLTHILDPSRNVEGNYRAYTVVTQSGRVFNGLLASETKTTLELFDPEGKKHIILREDVDEVSASNKSLMPEGFEKQASRPDIINLLEFLTARGKFLPIPLDKAATIVSTRGMFHSRNAPAERLIFPDWSPKTVSGTPFVLIDPQNGAKPNVIMLHSPQGRFPPQMPRRVELPCQSSANAIHFLSGVSGWGFPLGSKGSVSMIVRLHYKGGAVEDHSLKNGEHFADYIRRVDVPASKFAFRLRGRQIRFFSIQPQNSGIIEEIELIKGSDATAPIVMAITVETASQAK